MVLAVDVSYRSREAVVGGILFRDWRAGKPDEELVITCPIAAAYIPGKFFRRELPCISALLAQISRSVDCIVIDGFVWLGRERKPGLGKHLRDSLNGRVAIIGVAKRAYKETPESTEVLRGRSRRPLYVTADGVPEEEARSMVKNMHGRDRIPTLLQHVHRLCTEAATGYELYGDQGEWEV